MRPASAPAAAEIATGGAGHALLPHTADVGIHAWAPDLPRLFAESGAALADTIADVEPGHTPSRWIPIRLEATDPVGLAFAWLNALIGEAEIARAALVALEVGRLTRTPGGAWSLEARAGITPFDATGVRVRRPPKSATYHGLAVERIDTGWSLLAYLDV